MFMRAVVTRVDSASVEIGGAVKGAIGKGFLVLLGVHRDDTEAEAGKIADKICGLRVFGDGAGKMNVNPEDAGAELLIISQFTLMRTLNPAVRASPPPPGRIRRSHCMSGLSPNAGAGASGWRPESSALK